MRTSILFLVSIAFVGCGVPEDQLNEAEAALATAQEERRQAASDLAEREAELTDARSALSVAEEAAEAAEEEVALLRKELDRAEDDSVQADETLLEIDAALSEAQSDLVETEDELAELRSERSTLESALADEIAKVEALLVRFDPEIRDAITQAQAVAEADACDAWQTATLAGEELPDLGEISTSVLEGLPNSATIDGDLVSAAATRCAEEAEAQLALAALREPKGDGFHTVGLEIAAGRWRSSGTGSSCYWQRSPDGEPDNILDNHFGNAGGSVTLREGEEFESDGCGLWEFVG